MNKSNTLKTICFLSLIGLLAGCSQEPVQHSELFAPDDHPRAMDRLLNAQAARGAGSDATLYTCHFTGADLNSLGKSKLDLVLTDNAGGSMKVWMAVADDDWSEARRMAVGEYLKDHGLALDQIQFGHGPNPDTDHAAAKGILDLPKTDSTDSTASATNSTPGAATPAGGPASAAPTGATGTP